jgi:hypothetical protein
MPETFQSVIDYVNEVYPNRLNSTTIITIINRECRKLYPYLTNSTINSTTITTTSDYGLYPLPTTNVHFDMIESVHVGDSTAGSTTIYQPYEYAPSTDALGDYSFYNPLDNHIGIFPEPTTAALPILIRYREPPVTILAASDTTTYMNFDEDLTEVLINNVLSRIAKSGNFPRVTLANNYTVDGIVGKKDMMLRDAKKKQKDPNESKYDWRDWVNK